MLEEAILLAPTDPFSHFLLGVTLQGTWDGRLALPLEQRDYARAEVALKRARELEPLNGLYDLFLIENLQLQGRIDEAVTALEALKGARKFQFDWTRLFNMQVKAAALAGIQDDQTLEKLWNTASILLYLPMRDLMASAFPEPGAADRDDISRYEARKEGIVHIARLMDQGNVPVIERGISVMLRKKTGKRMGGLYEAFGRKEKVAMADALVQEAASARARMDADIAANRGTWAYYKSQYLK